MVYIVSLIKYYSSDQLEKNEMGWASASDSRVTYMVLAGRPEGKQPLGTPMHRWEDYYTDLQGVVQGRLDWICLAQDRER